MNFIVKVHAIIKRYRWTSKEKNLFHIFTKTKTDYADAQKKLILLQCVEDSYYYALFGQIITDLRKNNNLQVDQYILRNFSVGSYRNIKRFVISKLTTNCFIDKKWTNIYESYCDGVAYSNEESLGILKDLQLFFEAKKIFNNLASKNELIGLKIDNIIIGDLIYDTYLRFKPAPTVDIKDTYLAIIVWKALRNIVITKKYFDTKRPDILLQSYSTYIQHGICARIALQYGTDVYTFGNYQKMEKKLDLEDTTHTVSTFKYKTDFGNLIEIHEKLKESKKALGNRLNGKVDISTSYMKESAYKVYETEIPMVKDSVVIFLHDFFDSPHCYRSMVFADFFEWLEFTVLELDSCKIPYFLKPHPNETDDSAKVVDEFGKKYPHIEILSAKITNKQLVEAGIKAGITVYGTVAHELAYMEVPIITCGDNPHSSYNFCFEAKTKKQYSNFIQNIEDLRYPNIKGIKYEVESFYYMHNLNLSSDEKDLNGLLSIFRQMNKNLDDKYDFTLYSRHLDLIKKNKAYISFLEKL